MLCYGLNQQQQRGQILSGRFVGMHRMASVRRSQLPAPKRRWRAMSHTPTLPLRDANFQALADYEFHGQVGLQRPEAASGSCRARKKIILRLIQKRRPWGLPTSSASLRWQASVYLRPFFAPLSIISSLPPRHYPAIDRMRRPNPDIVCRLLRLTSSVALPTLMSLPSALTRTRPGKMTHNFRPKL